jgi:hypothetical protein
MLYWLFKDLTVKFMRRSLMIVSLLMGASPAVAQAPPARIEIPRELTDPAMADKLANTMQGVTSALLDLRVGEVQAALEGRKPTAAERKLTVGDLERRDDPNFERNLRRGIAETGPKIAQGMKALSDALPAVVKALDDVSRAVDRAAANMPDPTYPKR